MPVRSLNSAVFKWPDRQTVLEAARRWARALRETDASVAHVGCVGSYARGDWGVGSDLDVIVILGDGGTPTHPTESPTATERRTRYEPRGLPVQADLWVYTAAEWSDLEARSHQLASRLQREWIELG